MNFESPCNSGYFCLWPFVSMLLNQRTRGPLVTTSLLSMKDQLPPLSFLLPYPGMHIREAAFFTIKIQSMSYCNLWRIRSGLYDRHNHFIAVNRNSSYYFCSRNHLLAKFSFFLYNHPKLIHIYQTSYSLQTWHTWIQLAFIQVRCLRNLLVLDLFNNVKWDLSCEGPSIAYSWKVGAEVIRKTAFWKRL